MAKISHHLSVIADLLEADLRGDAGIPITGIATLQTAGPGDISFLSNTKYCHLLQVTKASAVIMKPEYAEAYSGPALFMSNPYAGYAVVANLFDKKTLVEPGIHETAIIHPSAEIHPSASIAPYVMIGANANIGPRVIISGHCQIGDDVNIAADSYLHSNVSIYHAVTVGMRVIIHSGVVIGSDGFGIVKDDARWQKIPQLGGVVIGDDVEIGANTTIDRGALDNTIIGNGVKLDNQIQIAHNVVIGDHTAIAGCVGIAGSTKIGKHCIIGGGAGFSGHLTIADNVSVTGMAMITKSISKSDIYSSGTGLLTNKEWRKNAVRFRQLDDMARRLKNLEKLLAQQARQKDSKTTH